MSSQLSRIADFFTHDFNLRKHKSMVLFGIEKAYDTIWINCLLFKLISLHLPDYLFFLKFYFGGLTFTAHLNDTTSIPKPNPHGLPQRAVLSTILFSLYLSDMSRPRHTHLSLYSDDSALLSQSWRPDIISDRFSNAMTTLPKYFTTPKLRVNTHKIKSFYFPSAVPPSGTLFKFRTSLCPGLRPSAI